MCVKLLVFQAESLSIFVAIVETSTAVARLFFAPVILSVCRPVAHGSCACRHVSFRVIEWLLDLR